MGQSRNLTTFTHPRTSISSTTHTRVHMRTTTCVRPYSLHMYYIRTHTHTHTHTPTPQMTHPEQKPKEQGHSLVGGGGGGGGGGSVGLTGKFLKIQGGTRSQGPHSCLGSYTYISAGGCIIHGYLLLG